MLFSLSPSNSIIAILGSIAEHALHCKFMPVLVEWSIRDGVSHRNISICRSIKVGLCFHYALIVFCIEYPLCKLLVRSIRKLFTILCSHLIEETLINCFILKIRSSQRPIVFRLISLLSSFLMSLGLDLIDDEDLVSGVIMRTQLFYNFISSPLGFMKFFGMSTKLVICFFCNIFKSIMLVKKCFVLRCWNLSFSEANPSDCAAISGISEVDFVMISPPLNSRNG